LERSKRNEKIANQRLDRFKAVARSHRHNDGNREGLQVFRNSMF